MFIDTPEWVKDAIFYQIFPDRFASSKRVSKDGLHLEPWNSPPTPYGFKGGDLLGICEHMDYLQDLGVNAIYLNPITASASNHRYHTYDYFKIDPLLGGDAALAELLKTAHNHGIRVILDGVFNHASRGFWQFHHVLENGEGSPYIDWFHFNPDRLNGQKHWGAYPTESELQLLNKGISSYDAIGYRSWWNLPALPKFNTKTPAVREFLWNAAVHWIKFGADGWRLDVPGEIDDDSFWQEFRRRVKRTNPEAYIVGEIWVEAKRWLQGDQFDAVMNYLLPSALFGWLLGKKIPDYLYKVGENRNFLKPLNTLEFADRIDYLLKIYDPTINYAQFNLLDSHDTPRFLTVVGGDISALKLSWLFLFTFVGAPCIYYGDEIGMMGGPDPDCRKSFPWDEDSWNSELREYVKSLSSLRKAQPELRRGTYHRIHADEDTYAFARRLGSERIIVVLNPTARTLNADFSVSTLGLENKTLITLFGNGKARVSGGMIRGLKLSPKSGVVFKA